jgi:F-type H+-transporting ATPase subunit a
MDTIYSTLVAGALVLILGFWARSALTKRPEDHVPSKVQLIWEAIVGQVNTQVEDNLGRVHPFVVPLAVALFFFILFANWLELLPTEINHHLHLLPAPTADTNLTYAMAIMAMVGVWAYGIKEKGLKGYLKHFLEPFPVLLPLNILEELTKPITLALRLFGNIFAGGIMLALIGLIPWYAAWAPNLLWKLFDMAIGGIQAFIFALLTILYFGMAGAGHGEDETHAADGDEDRKDSPALAH